MPKVVTRSQVVHAQLRDEILRGALPPGHRLRFEELSRRFSVSQSVLREAFTRLEEQGLTVSSPMQGFRVTPLSLKELDQLTEARIEIETMVLRKALERGDMVWESSVVAAHHHLANTPDSRPDGATVSEDWFGVHEAFHQSVLRGCGNERMFAVASTLRDAASLYRRWSRPVGGDVDRDVANEHRALLDAVLARDAATATALLTHHIQRTSDSLRAVADGEEVAEPIGPTAKSRGRTIAPKPSPSGTGGGKA